MRRFGSIDWLAIVTTSVALSGCFDPEESGSSEGSTGASSSSTGGPSMTVGPSSGPSMDPSTTAPTSTADPTTTDPTSGSSSSTSVDPDSDTGQGVCGDGQVDQGEICDDGVNAGMTEGDCAPDCSAVVQRKLIRLSQNSTSADFSPGPNDVVVADSFCPNGFLAFFTDGVNRVASVAPLMGNGQVDWVLQPWTEYVNPNGDPMWTTTELRLLGVSDDHQWVGLDNPLLDSVDFGYTGMRGDYTTATANCGGWSMTNALTESSFSQAHQTNQRFVGIPDDMTGGLCSLQHEFICVEQ